MAKAIYLKKGEEPPKSTGEVVVSVRVLPSRGRGGQKTGPLLNEYSVGRDEADSQIAILEKRADAKPST